AVPRRVVQRDQPSQLRHTGRRPQLGQLRTRVPGLAAKADAVRAEADVLMPAGEDRLEYEGWRVAAAAGAGVFVSFASLLVYTFGVFLKPLTETFGWSREGVSAAFGIAAMTVAVCSPAIGV